MSIRSVFPLLLLLLVPSVVAAQDGDSVGEAELLISVSSAGEAVRGEQSGTLRAGALRQGQQRAFPIVVPPNRCVAVFGRGGAGLDNIDVSLVRGRNVLARDTTASAEAELRFCAGTRPERARMQVRAFRGSGLFAAAAFLLPEGATPTDPVQAPAGGPEAGTGALVRLEARARAVVGDYVPVSPPGRENLRAGERIDRTVLLSPGRCYRVVAAAEEGVVDLDLVLVGPTGAEVQQDTGDDREPTLGVLRPLCPALPGQYHLIARVETGAGAFAWQVYGSGGAVATGPAAPAGPRFRVGGAGDDFVAQRIRALHQQRGDGRQPITDLASGELRTNEQREIRLRVEGGSCYTVIGAGVPSIRELDIRVLDAFGNERAHDEQRDAFPTASFCAQVAGEWRVVTRVFIGYGRYGVQIFRR
jgi:hypothetical protein